MIENVAQYMAGGFVPILALIGVAWAWMVCAVWLYLRVRFWRSRYKAGPDEEPQQPEPPS